MKHPIGFVRGSGRASRQAHVNLPDGTYEREAGREGFYGPASHFYHRHPPTGWSAFEGPLKPRAFDLAKLATPAPSPWQAPLVLSNGHVKLRYWRTEGPMPRLARNADGDDLLFVHEGSGDLFCDYGHLAIETGDYLLIPRGTLWRLECRGTLSALLIEATNAGFGLPDKGLLGRHALFDPALLHAPEIDDTFLAQQGTEGWQVEVKRREALSRITFPFNPLDAVGWKGDLSVVRLNLRHIRPLSSHRYHLPPSAHTTFLAPRFVVCTFCPRPFETDPEALKVPFFHNNDDYDEVLFYHAGEFFSRDNIGAGMLTFHPAGFTHGPHPGALRHMLRPRKTATDEYAVMIDARDPLEVAALPPGVEWQGYVDSWKEGAAPR